MRLDERKTVAVDFDGVLHQYITPFSDPLTIADPPIPGALEWLDTVSKVYNVAIFSTRNVTAHGQKAIHDWLYKHMLEIFAEPDVVDILYNRGVYFPTHKPPALIYIDDRGFRFSGFFPSPDEIRSLTPWKYQPPESFPPIVGVFEISVLASVSPQAVSNWIARVDDFPQPLARLQCGPIYSRQEIEAWLKQTKRMK